MDTLACSVLRLDSYEKVESILQQYLAMPVKKEAPQAFLQHLTQRMDSWFVEVEDVGLIYLTNVVPRHAAILNVMFWDGKLAKERRELLRSVLATAMDEFDLARIQANVTWENIPLKAFYVKTGLTVEGILRNAWVDEQGMQDLIILSVLKQEVEDWPRIPTTSSDFSI